MVNLCGEMPLEWMLHLQHDTSAFLLFPLASIKPDMPFQQYLRNRNGKDDWTPRLINGRQRTLQRLSRC